MTVSDLDFNYHGKTTMADHLIAAAGGGVLHTKQAGKLRFMDYRDDEQQRAITMKSACIVLKFRDHVINLIDSPGHVDFCSEVSTAVRLSDGAVVLVDTVEGVHIQTHAVLRQAWLERLKPCLVLNKIDRLITELKFTPAEAYARCQSIIGEVNNIIHTFRSEKYFSDVDSILTKPTATGEEVDDEEAEDEEDAFSPERGNVAFGSAGDGWAFRIDHFSDLYAAKLGASAKALKKALWGHHYFVPKTKLIVSKKAAAGKYKPMFVQFVLEPLWQVYDAAMQGSDGVEMLNKIIKSMNLTIPSRELQQKDPRLVLQAVMSRWLPLSETVLGMVIECLPDPASAMRERVERLLPEEVSLPEANMKIEGELERVRKAVETCDSSEDAPCVVFVSKMVALPVEMLPRHNAKGELISHAEMSTGDMDAGGRECFLAFARVFSGVVTEGQRMYVLSALYNPTAQEPDNKHIQVATIESLYRMMGRGLEPLGKAVAGHLIAIRGLGQQILKTATLCSTPFCWPFASMRFQAAPIVRVAIEPSDPADMGALTKGLRLLNRADPFVEVTVSSSGDHVISAAGEVHLERCIKDLKERFARVEFEVSPPLVGFRETIEVEEIGGANQSSVAQVVTPNGRSTIRVHVTRLPDSLTQVLDGSYEFLRNIIDENKVTSRLSTTSKQGSLYPGENSGDDPVTSLRNRLLAAVETGLEDGKTEEVKKWTDKLKRIWALGPRRVGPNILILPDETGSVVKEGGSVSSANGDAEDVALVKGYPRVSDKLGFVGKQADRSTTDDDHSMLFKEAESLESSVIAGFQLATAQGPLCEEPMWGLAFTVEVLVNTRERLTADFTESSSLGPDATAGSAGVESYGGALSDELRRKTSGFASPQLVLSHWEPLPEDPFFVPKTEEEIEEFGDGSSVLQNTARKLIDSVRRRKGLPVEEKIVQFATKQRTRARKV
ncbi:hypothetical protein R1flu_000770 [Riccia fluitans]|uniref:Tr-type G domain-containing protein n=1 Tax=Riccia fluitans TaxID=41844 RepID=A0ABD1Y1D1_9MARC